MVLGRGIFRLCYLTPIIVDQEDLKGELKVMLLMYREF